MIDIKINTKNVSRWLDNIAARQLPYAAMNTLNKVAFKVKDEEVAALDKHLDRPTPFTRRGYEVVKANRDRLIASVRARQVQNEYLKYQVRGGARGPKKTAIVIPSEVKLNQYGNMPKGIVRRMLVDKKRYFSGIPKGHNGAPAGIWRRLGTTSRKLSKSQRGNVQLQLMVSYEPKATYKGRLPFNEVAEITVYKIIKSEFRTQLKKTLASAR